MKESESKRKNRTQTYVTSSCATFLWNFFHCFDTTVDGLSKFAFQMYLYMYNIEKTKSVTPSNSFFFYFNQKRNEHNNNIRKMVQCDVSSPTLLLRTSYPVFFVLRELFFIILYIFAFAVSNFMFCLIYIFINEISFDVMYQEKRTWLEPISSSHIQAKRNK